MASQTSLNQTVKRFVTDVILNLTHFSFKHKGVVYYVKRKGDTETIVLAENHRWRDGYLMVVMRDKDMDAKEARELINGYVNRVIWCQKCHSEWGGEVSFRIDIRGNRIVRMVCARCDPTVDDIVRHFENLEGVKRE